MINEEILKQLSFISELEKLKIIYRKNKIIDQKRYENSAEHSWHIAVMALIFMDSSAFKEIDILKVLKMLLIHDVIEIDVGDTFLYNEESKSESIMKEKEAAKRIFGLLPDKQARRFMSLWNEFEERQTKEALFAAAMDGLQPLINHYLTASKNDNPYKMVKSEVYKKKAYIKEVSLSFWEIAEDFIKKGVDRGLYIDDEPKNTSSNNA